MSLTPMIDAIFLLLIFFMYSRFRTPEGELSARLPREGGVVTSNEDVEEALRRQILVEMTRELDGVVVVRVDEEELRIAPEESPEGAEFALGGLVSVLSRRREEKDDCFVILRPTTGVPFGIVMGCFDSARMAGIQDVSFAPPGKEGI